MKSPTGLESSSFYAMHATDNPVIEDRLEKVIAEAVRIAPATMLDIGCGRGTLIEAMRRRMPATSYTGLELSESSASAARANGIDVVVGDLSAPFPFADGSFDLVTFGEVIEHLFDPDFALDEIRRVLRPNGRLIVTTPNLVAWSNRILFPLGVQPLYTETSSRKKYGRRLTLLGQNSSIVQGHIRVMTTRALLELVRDRGFAVEVVQGCRFSEFDANPITRAVDGFFCRFPMAASGVIATATRGV